MPNVLVVEDDETIRQFTRQVLLRNGFLVEVAVDGIAAVEKLAHVRYDAIVLDLMMPRMDGFGVLRFLQSIDASLLLKTVVATAYPRDAAKKELSGICRVIVKPFDAGRLLDAVQECVMTKGGDGPPAGSRPSG